MDAAAQRHEEMLQDPAYFLCRRTHTLMRKQHCVTRRTQGLLTGLGRERTVPYECRGCDQGEQIEKELEMGEQGKKLCLLCHEQEPVARGLCHKCYDEMKRPGRLNEFPRKDRTKGLPAQQSIHSEDTPEYKAPQKAQESETNDRDAWKTPAWPIDDRHDEDTFEISTRAASSPEKIRPILLDFNPYPAAWERLQAEAAANFRTVEMEIMYMLHEGLDVERSVDDAV